MAPRREKNSGLKSSRISVLPTGGPEPPRGPFGSPLPDHKPGGPIKKVNPLRREPDDHFRTGIALETRSDEGLEQVVSDLEVEDCRISERFGRVDLRGHRGRRKSVEDDAIGVGPGPGAHAQVLGPHPEDDLLCRSPLHAFGQMLRDRDPEVASVERPTIPDIA